jgi:hypothetical protein
MSDHDRVKLEPSEGVRPPTSTGERMLVAVAALVLVGGALIAIGNGMRGLAGQAETGASTLSAAPSASGASARTPRPSPTPRVLAVEPGATPSTDPPPWSDAFVGWIRARADLAIRARPQEDATVVGTLAAGSAAYATERNDIPSEGWLQVDAPAPTGWVAITRDGQDVIERPLTWASPYSGEIWGLAAGPDGFVAAGSPPGAVPPPPTFLASSVDGKEWQVAEVGGPRGWGAPVVAWGAGGWLAIAATSEPSANGVWIWNSSRGRVWSLLGRMTDAGQVGYPAQLVGSERGFILVALGGRSYSFTFWFSPDGLTWHEVRETALPAPSSPRVIATSAGFYAVGELTGVRGDPLTRAAFSADGRRWVEVTDGPEGRAAMLADLQGRMIAIDTDPESGSARVWDSTVVGGRVAWRRDPAADEVFAGAVVTSLVSDGQRAVALGWNRSSDVGRVWTTRGETWTGSSLPTEFGGVPKLAAAGPTGIAVVGSRPTLRGTNPVIWHETPTGTWASEPSPFIELVPDVANGCPSAPNDAFEWVTLDLPTAVACFGSEPISFRAWSVPCDGCFGLMPGTAEPAWLANPGPNQVYLAPIESNDYGFQHALLDPSLALEPSPTNAWVEVTGHFDDPAAGGCRYTPAAEDEAYYMGRAATITACRLQFVITSLEVVDGP